MTDTPPFWADLVTQTWPKAEKLANRIEDKQLRGQPQGECLIAVAILLGRALGHTIARNDDVAPIVQVITEIAAAGGNKPPFVNQ